MNRDQPLKLPVFLGVGPPRTGTTWLHETLVGRANLPPANKEIKFFDRHYDLGLEWYAANFDQSSKLVTGEICPTYFASAAARERIAQLSPRPKIICTFRDPVVRVFSLYKMKRTYGDITWDFKDALERDPELMESSRYAYHLAEWRRIFGEANVLAAFYEDFASDP
ncbi:MAG: sulfotransferase family protein, partial [Candidatus Binataceae bacterium]